MDIIIWYTYIFANCTCNWFALLQNGQRCKRKSSCLSSESNGCEQLQVKLCKLKKQRNSVPSDAFYQNIRGKRMELNFSIRNNGGKKKFWVSFVHLRKYPLVVTNYSLKVFRDLPVLLSIVNGLIQLLIPLLVMHVNV